MYTTRENLKSIMNKTFATAAEIGRVLASVPQDPLFAEDNLYDMHKAGKLIAKLNNDTSALYDLNGYLQIHRWIQSVFQLARAEFICLQDQFYEAINFLTDAIVVERYINYNITNNLPFNNIYTEDSILYSIRFNSLDSILAGKNSKFGFNDLSDNIVTIRQHRNIIQAINHALIATADIYELLDPDKLVFDLAASDLNYTLTGNIDTLALELDKQEIVVRAKGMFQIVDTIKQKREILKEFKKYGYFQDMSLTPTGKNIIEKGTEHIRREKRNGSYDLYSEPSVYGIVCLFSAE